jgi:hypothetical protein
MNKQDEKRVREIAREETQKWYADHVALPALMGIHELTKKFCSHGKAQAHEPQNTQRNRS